MHRSRDILRVVPLLVLVLLPLATAQASDERRRVIGGLRSVEGQSIMIRGGREIFARSGMRVFSSDVIRTGKAATLAVVLLDKTEIAVGPASEVVLAKFNDDPGRGEVGLAVSALAGTAEFVTGALGKAFPASVAVATPVSTIGIRGTRFLVEVD